jgi:putative ABC transport system substrate-binding protein
MPRRTFMVIIAGGLVAAPLAAEAQPAGKVARIGFLGLNPGANPHRRGAFLQGLRDLGYVEGRNVVIEYRSAEGKLERLSALAAELVALKVDVIVTGGGTPTALAAKQATRTLPIVFSSATDPVTDGLVTSLARPGGEHTDKDMLQGAEVAARALGVRLQFIKARGPADFDRAFSDMIRRAGALAVWGSAIFNSARRRLVDLVAKHRLPTVYTSRDFVDAGGPYDLWSEPG